MSRIEKMFESPFEDDRKFMIEELLVMSRDRLPEFEDYINQTIYLRVLEMIKEPKNEIS